MYRAATKQKARETALIKAHFSPYNNKNRGFVYCAYGCYNQHDVLYYPLHYACDNEQNVLYCRNCCPVIHAVAATHVAAVTRAATPPIAILNKKLALSCCAPGCNDKPLLIYILPDYMGDNEQNIAYCKECWNTL